MANTRLQKISGHIELDNGMDMYGNIKTIPVSLGTFNKNNFNPDKLLNIVIALEPCLNKEVAGVYFTQVNSITG